MLNAYKFSEKDKQLVEPSGLTPVVVVSKWPSDIVKRSECINSFAYGGIILLAANQTNEVIEVVGRVGVKVLAETNTLTIKL